MTMLGETVLIMVGPLDHPHKDYISTSVSFHVIFLGMVCGNDDLGGNGVGMVKSAEFFTWKPLMKIWRDWSIERAFFFISRVKSCLVGVGRKSKVSRNWAQSSYDGRIAMLRPWVSGRIFDFVFFPCFPLLFFIAHSLLILITSFRE
jgi:hypothetical protein